MREQIYEKLSDSTAVVVQEALESAESVSYSFPTTPRLHAE
jgi:hypothetical protein